MSDRNGLDVEVIPQALDSVPDGVYMFGVTYSAEVQEPASNHRSQLRLRAADTSTRHLHRFTVFIENLSMENQGLLACVLNMQTGTSVSPNELERLRREEYFDYFEILVGIMLIILGIYRIIKMNSAQHSTDLKCVQGFLTIGFIHRHKVL